MRKQDWAAEKGGEEDIKCVRVCERHFELEMKGNT